MSLSGIAVKRSITVLMIFVVLAGVGLFAVTQLGIDYFPKVDLGMIKIVTIMPGAGPEEIEDLITEVVEKSVSGIEGVETLISTSRNGMSIVTLELSNSADIDEVESNAVEAVDRVKGDFPEGAMEPYILAMESSMKPLIILAFTSEKITGAELRYLVEDEITPRLGRVEGVSSVELSGGQIRQINVVVYAVRLSETEIPLSQVYQVLNAVSGDRPGGEIEGGSIEVSVTVQSGFDDLESIENTVVGIYNGRPIKLEEVANVVDGYRDPQNYIHLDGGDAVIAIFRKSSDANTVNTSRRLEIAIDEATSEYSETLTSTIIYDQSGFITGSMKDLLITGIQAVLLAAVVLTFFLGSISNAGIVSISMPLSFVASFAVMYLFGISINIMSLAGLSVAIGMIVDNSVVVLENIHRLRRDGEERVRAAKNGAAQVGMAVTASTLTTVAVFVPMMFVPGMSGQIFRDLSITIATALIISLFVSQSLIPLLASRSKRMMKKHSEKSISGRIEKWLARLEVYYSKKVRWFTEHAKFVLIPLLLLFVASMIVMQFIPKTFLPDPAEGTIDVDFRFAPGTGLEQSDSLSLAIENSILEIMKPGDLSSSYLSVGRREGMGAIFGSNSSNKGSLSLYFVKERERAQSIEEYDENIREILDGFPGVEYQLSSGIPIGNAYPVEIIIFGSDLGELRSIGDMIAEGLSGIEGTVDIRSSLESRLVQLDFEPDEDVLYLRGQSASRIGLEVTIGMLGLNASTLVEGEKQLNINLRYAEQYRYSRESVSGLNIYGLPLDAWGEMQNRLVPEEIGRRNGIRTVSITCGIRDRALGDVASDVEMLMDTIAIGEHRYEIIGDAKDRKEAFGYMGLAIAVAIALVYMIMASQFESLLEPFIIIVEVPLALIGVIWTLYLTGTTMGLTALVGLLALAGIVVNNGIVYIDFANHLRRESGISAKEAIIEAGQKRLRPILMTAITTILALLPLALGTTDSSVMWAPMARTLAGGLAAATFLTLIVLPVLYVKLDGLHRRR